jgi:hypothetical protein
MPRQLAFHLLSGEPCTPAGRAPAHVQAAAPVAAPAPLSPARVAATAALQAASPTQSLVWEKGCAYVVDTGEQAAAPLNPTCGRAPPAETAVVDAALPPPLCASSVMPFARDDELSRRATEAIAPIERELMQLSMVKDRLDAEYARMPLSAGRTVVERRRKAELEAKLDELHLQMGHLKARLRALMPMRR